MAAMVASMPFDPTHNRSSAGPSCMPSDQAVASGGSEPEQSEAQGSRKEAVAFPSAGSPAAENHHSHEKQDSEQSSSDDEDEEGSEDDEEGGGNEEDDETEADAGRIIDWLMEVESEAADAQEYLEEESLNQLREEVRAELAEKLSGDELEAAVQREMDDYVAEWEEELERLEEESSKFQEQLEDLNVSLPDLYKIIEKQAPEGCMTEAWRKRVHWAGNPASEQVTELVKSAEKDLENHRPLMSKHGKFVEEGASDFLESKRPDKEDGNTSPVGWGVISELAEPRPSVEKPGRFFGSKSWAAVYSVTTPEQASRLGLKFPGANKVEEIADIAETGDEATALAEESANGLTERQKKKLKRVREADDLLEMKKSPRKKQASKRAVKKKVPNGVVPLAQATQAEKASDALLASDASTSANEVVENVQNEKSSTTTDRQIVPEAPIRETMPEKEQSNHLDSGGPEACIPDKIPENVEKPSSTSNDKAGGTEDEEKPAEESEEGEQLKKTQKKQEKESGEEVKLKSPPKLIIAKADPPELIVVSDDDDDDDDDIQKNSTVENDTTTRQPLKRPHEQSSPLRSTKKRKHVLDSSDEENNNKGGESLKNNANASEFKTDEILDVSSGDERDLASTSHEVASFRCTICNYFLKSPDVVSHPVLRVIVCKLCKLRYEKILFTKDDDTDAECTWCGKAGDIICCDNGKCSKVFCEVCIRRNTTHYQAITMMDDWNCFVCDSSPLKDLTKRLEDAEQRRVVNEKTPAFPQPRVKRRKNIRKVIGDEELSEATRKMQELEKERQERLKKWYESANRAKKNKVPFGKCRASASAGGADDEGHLCVGDCKTLGCVVNITERDTGEPLVRVPPSLSKQLKPHQLSGVRFMWENCIESVSKVKAGSKGLGCILAHCMGLGKTLQVITFLYAAMRAADLKTALIVVPVNVLHNWKSEFSKWKPLETPQLVVYMLDDIKDNAQRAGCLKNWKEKGGVMLIGYAAFRILCTGKTVKDSETRALFRQYLQDPGADLLVCDEAHTIKNEKADITQELQQVKTLRRIALTGSPLQNNLMEYYCMVNFVREGLLGTPQEFRNRFQNPIANGQHADSTLGDVKKMKQRAHILHSRLEGFVQRRDTSVLNSAIPHKCVWVISVRLSPLQKQLYRKYISACLNRRSLFDNFHSLSKIWNHPDVLSIAKEVAKDSKEPKDIDKDEEADENAPPLDKEKRNPEVNSFEWCQEILGESERNVIENGSKMVLILRLLAMSSSQGDKTLVFSQSLVTLNLIESFLEKTPPPSGLGSWTRGKDWLRIDGSTPSAARHRIAGEFNDPRNTGVKCCLVSTRAGSLGINLTGACRVIIVDGSWNPTHDLQALFRAWRLGQTKPVHVYRLLAFGTMEEKIYHRQLAKEGIAARVLDAHQVGRHLTADDLEMLYSLDDDEDEVPEENNNMASQALGQGGVKARKAKPKAFTMPSDAPPRDELMALLLLDYRPRLIANYHEHGPLLEDLEDEKLSPEEKFQAWEAFRREHDPQLGASGEEHQQPVPGAQDFQSIPRPAPGPQQQQQWIPRPASGPHQQSSIPRPAPGPYQQQQQSSTPSPAPGPHRQSSIPSPAPGPHQQSSIPSPAPGPHQQSSIPRPAPGPHQQSSNPRPAPGARQQQQQSIPRPTPGGHQQQQQSSTAPGAQKQSIPRPAPAPTPSPQGCNANSHAAMLARLGKSVRDESITCGKCHQMIGWNNLDENN